MRQNQMLDKTTTLEGKHIQWTTEHQEAFDALKEVLSTTPVLGCSEFSKDFFLEADASQEGLGGCCIPKM